MITVVASASLPNAGKSAHAHRQTVSVSSKMSRSISTRNQPSVEKVQSVHPAIGTGRQEGIGHHHQKRADGEKQDHDQSRQAQQLAATLFAAFGDRQSSRGSLIGQSLTTCAA